MPFAEPGELVATYAYEDLTLRTLYEVLRYRTADGGKTFRQRRPADRPGEWIANLDGVDRIPYRWPDLDLHRDEKPADPVFVVEGEKDVETLRDLGLTATTNAQGAGWDWPFEWSYAFQGLERVVIVPDNDDQGRRAAEQRARVIARTVRDVRILELPDLPAKGDVTDYLEGGGGSLAALLELADAAPRFVPIQPEPDPGDGPPLPDGGEETVRPLPVRWIGDAVASPPPEPPVLVEGLLRAGELCAVVAPRAIGKSFWAMNLAYLLAQGGGSFLGLLKVLAQVNVLIAQGELDEWGTASRWATLCGRDAPPAGVFETFERWRLRIMTRRGRRRDTDGREISEEWIDAVLDPRLEATIVEHKIGCLIIDPWAVYFAGKENSNDEAEAALDKLRDLAMRTGCAVVIVHHIAGKGGLDKLDPEDLWRGASRLADWASTRVTMLPHYRQAAGAKGWEKAGKTRQQARRYLDVHVLRRSGPSLDDFSIEFDGPTGWWQGWTDPAAAAAEARGADPSAGRWQYDPEDIAKALADAGGAWVSITAARESLREFYGMEKPPPHERTKDYLERAHRAGLLEWYRPGGGKWGVRLPGGPGQPALQLVPPEDEAPFPTDPPPDFYDDERF